MADFDYYGADYGVENGSRVVDALRGFGLANWAGAITSLGLIAGLAGWAVDLTFRDVSSVPVILALEGPMRVEPEHPGGTIAPFQGMALSDITSGGAAAPAPEQIVLAPPPVAIEAPALSDRIAAAAAPEAEASPAALSAENDAPVVDVAMLDATLEGLEEIAPVEDAASPAGAFDFRSAIAAAIAEAQPGLAEAQPGIATSVRPRPRPAAARGLAASTPIEAPAQLGGVAVASVGLPDRSVTDAVLAAGREVDPSSLPAGTRVVQLGAYDSVDVARAEWVRLEGRFADYLAGKSRMIEPAHSGGRDFWRLRAVGFADGADARRFCAELLARDADCIPVTVR